MADFHESYYEITWYPGAYPSETGGITLQSTSHYLEDGSNLAVQIAQMVQRQEGHRWDTPNFWVRGNRAATLDWEEARIVQSPGAALAGALEAAESLPSTTGWLRIDIADESRAWAVTPAAIRAVGGRHAMMGELTLLLIRWTVDTGSITEIAVSAEEGAITTETGVEFLTEEEGYYLALEELT